MAIDSASPRSRRALLGAALGAGVATVASALGRPLPAEAADGGSFLLGTLNNADSTTQLVMGSSANALRAAGGNGMGVIGESGANAGVYGSGVDGVRGHSTSNTGAGVAGESQYGTGVLGASPLGTGVRAESTHGTALTAISDNGKAIIAESTVVTTTALTARSMANGTGVYGYSGGTDQPQPNAPFYVGVYGWAQWSNSAGVHGVSIEGAGVRATATSGRGVDGVATSGFGVRGKTTSGIAGYFTALDTVVGTAIRAVGRVKFDNCSGLATILAGTKSVVVTPGIDVTTSSAVVATLQASAGGTTTVHRCVVNGPANTFTIYLTANSTTNVKVAWHVFG